MYAWLPAWQGKAMRGETKKQARPGRGEARRRGRSLASSARQGEAKRGETRRREPEAKGKGRQGEAWLCRRSGTALGGGGEASRRSSDDEEVHGTGQTNRLALASRESAAVVTGGHRDGLESQPCAFGEHARRASFKSLLLDGSARGVPLPSAIFLTPA